MEWNCENDEKIIENFEGLSHYGLRSPVSLTNFKPNLANNTKAHSWEFSGKEGMAKSNR